MKILFTAIVAILSCGSIARAGDRPNIVLILCDDMGFSDLGCFGSEIDTPNIDRLAAGGLRFTDFHNNAKCTETRASLLSGLWHQQTKNLRKSNHITIPEVLRNAGYSTLMSGKWHLPRTPPDRGFDRYFGFLGGCINFFTGEDWGSGKNLMRLDRDVFHPPDDFYSTDAITDHAIDFLKDSSDPEKPFFLYLAHNAPHFPLHAKPEDIEKYKGRYDVGWDVIRQNRLQRMRELGVVDDNWRLSLRDGKVEAWSELTDSDKKFLLPMMEVYAAMVDRLDQNIGRLVEYLTASKQLDNTLIFFFSDNGACPYQRLRTDTLVPGPVGSDIAYDARWANMCNAPLRLYKQYAHQGGTQTPMIAHWPNKIKSPGTFNRQTSHIVDLMPTLIELAGARYPTEHASHEVLPMEGVSLAATLQGEQPGQRTKPICWEYQGNHAIRIGDWKLVAERSKDWELYDLADDRTETKDIAATHPEQVATLAANYDAWASRTGAKTHTESKRFDPSKQSQLFDLDTILETSP